MPKRGAAPTLCGVARSRISAALDVGAITALTLGIAYWCGDLTGFPKGNDALGHLSKLRLILDNWPHIDWNESWYAGGPNFEGWYPPGYHLLVAAVTRIHGTSATTAMNVVTGLSLVLLLAGSYGFLRLATRSRVIAWLGALAILAQPTLWSQVQEFGLYPRLLALGAGAAALPSAVLFGRTRSRVQGALLAFFLAGSLSAQPVVGVVMTGFAAGVVVALVRGPSLVARAKPLLGPAVVLGLLVSYFYVPLALVRQGLTSTQLVDRMPFPVPWGRFVWAHGGPTDSLVSWSPLTLPLVAAAALVAVAAVRRPSAHVDTTRLRLNTLRRTPSLDRFLADVEAASERRRRYRPLLVIGLWSWAFAGVFFVYCVLQHFVVTFPYYVNGLYPNALLVYAAYFAVLGSALLLTPVARRGAVPLLAAGAAAAGLLGLFLPGRTLDYNDAGRQLMEQMVAAHIPDQHLYRIADADTGASLFLNFYTQTPQTNGYGPGDLEPDWQRWLSDAILGQGQSEPSRQFLFDWYAVKWIMVHSPAPYDRYPAHYRLLAARTTLAPTWLWTVPDPTPLVTTITTRPLLFIGDALHYDLFLRALASANVDSSRLIPVDGGPALTRFTPDELRGYAEIVFWGSPQSSAAATLLDGYVWAGGHAFVDEGEGAPLFPAEAEPAGAIATVTLARSWGFEDADPAVLPPALLEALPPPDYAGTHVWQIAYPRPLRSGTTVLARAKRRVVLALRREGSGEIVWSGLNVPYLASSTHARAAVRFLLELATGTSAPAVATTGSEAIRVNAEHWQFTVPAGATGVLLREYAGADWQASDAVTGAALPIVAAGPGMIYIPLDASAGARRIELEYVLSLPEQAGIWMSFAGVAGLVLYGAGVARRRATKRTRRTAGGISHQAVTPE